jgi:hypothetical protein
VFAFVVYAILVWLAAAKWRRQWLSLVIILIALIGLILVALFHYQLSLWSHGRIYLPVLQVLLYPYTALVVVLGLYIAALPRRPITWVHCPICKYDLRGLDDPIESCPECGMTEELAKLMLGREFVGFPAPGARDEPDLSPVRGAMPRRAPRPRPASPQWPATAAVRASPDPANE